MLYTGMPMVGIMREEDCEDMRVEFESLRWRPRLPPKIVPTDPHCPCGGLLVYEGNTPDDYANRVPDGTVYNCGTCQQTYWCNLHPYPTGGETLDLSRIAGWNSS